MNVKDYTLGGLRLEYIGIEKIPYRLGDKMFFELFTSEDEMISSIFGEVRHCTEDPALGSDRVNYTFGVRIISMPPLEEKKYKNLIVKYCMELKNSFSNS